MSDAFLAAVAGSHSMAARARVVETYQESLDPDGTEIPVIGGDVYGDASAAIRHTLDLTTPGYQWDTHADGLITPYGNELFVERGVSLDGVTVEWVGLGYYRMWDPAQDGDSDRPVQIGGRDRMSGIIEGRLEQPVQYPATQTVGDIFLDLVRGIYPSATVTFDDGTDAEQVGRAVVVERKRYEFLRDLAASYGKVFYVAEDGTFRVETPPDPTVPIATLTGGRGGVLLKLSRELSRDGVYNAVVAEGDGTDDKPPVRAVVRDNNPESPTYYYGRYGKVPKFFTSEFLKTDAQCREAARSMLRQNLGLPYSADLSAVPNPALEVLDPVSVRDRDTAEQRTYVIKELTIPLTAAGAMTATMTEQVDYVPDEEGRADA
ncbi:DUF5047 domain-containing protein [Haloactinopolyspora alba]|uniref:DUF5047 domain-containing protein n=1 Tax=Haloactinopolyspora alba TaxID=648780 RepID=UPI00101B9754|nr:DUF5047 domain-containing protein [Haloactinopolyspora alba]